MGLEEQLAAAKAKAVVGAMKEGLGAQRQSVLDDAEEVQKAKETYDAVLNKERVLEVLYGKNADDEWYFLLPLKHEELTPLEEALYNAIDGSLAIHGHNAKRAEYAGCAALKVTKKKAGRFPASLDVPVMYADGVNYKVKLLKEDDIFAASYVEEPAFSEDDRVELASNYKVDALKEVAKEDKEKAEAPAANTGKKSKKSTTKKKKKKADSLEGKVIAHTASGKKGDEFTLELRQGSCYDKKGNIILLRTDKDTRDYFPGYKEPFEVIRGRTKIVTNMTGATNDTPHGSKAGGYFSAEVKRLEMTGQLTDPAAWVKLKIVEPGKVYKIVRYQT
jgi:hypothetical protein